MAFLIAAVGVLGFISMLYGLYFGIIAVVGNLKGQKPIPYAKPQRRIACLVPARNEETVVGFLVQSLVRQDYPRELYDIYVIVNNCTDDTRGAALRAGAKVLECDREVHSKGEVMRFAFDKLLNGDCQYDAFCIFDADNLVDAGFLQACNNALFAGYEVAQAYRDSKNPGDNWVAGCTSTFFWFMSRLYNNARTAMGISAALNGTGIVLGAGLVRRMGFDTSTLTEDLEYTAQCALAGVKIGFMRDAITYDEQPIKLKDSFTQRRRWGAGSLQCAKKYSRRLVRGVFKQKSMECLDIALLFFGMYAQLISLAPALYTIGRCIVKLVQSPMEGLRWVLMLSVSGIAGGVLTGALFVLLMAVLEHKTRRVKASTYALMWLYLLTWVPANLISLVTRPPKWTYIQHVSAVDIELCESAAKEPARQAAANSKETSV